MKIGCKVYAILMSSVLLACILPFNTSACHNQIVYINGESVVVQVPSVDMYPGSTVMYDLTVALSPGCGYEYELIITIGEVEEGWEVSVFDNDSAYGPPIGTDIDGVKVDKYLARTLEYDARIVVTAPGNAPVGDHTQNITIWSDDNQHNQQRNKTICLHNNVLFLPNDLPVIDLISPAGGEVLRGVQEITWLATDLEDEDENLMIDLHIDSGDGRTWVPISLDEINDGSYMWDTSYTPNGNYKLKAVATDFRSDFSETILDQDITIKNPTLELTYPTGGEELQDTIQITWTTDNLLGAGTIDLKYSSTGATWKYIANSVSDSGTHQWDTTTVEDGYYWLKAEVVDSDGALGRYILDEMTTVNNQGIPKATIIYPEIGDIVGGEVVIKWNYELDSGKTIKDQTIEICKSAGGSWETLAQGLSGNSYTWDTTDTTRSENFPDGMNYRLRIKVIDNSDLVNNYEDTATSEFTVFNNDNPSITITNPGPGKNLAGTVKIAWSATDPDSQSGFEDDSKLTVKLSILPSAGSPVTIIDGFDNTGSYEWGTATVDDQGEYTFPDGDYRIEATVVDTHGGEGSFKTEMFTIYNPDPPWIEMTYPVGGEKVSGNLDITWTAGDNDGDGLSIDLIYNTIDGVDNIIASGLENTESYTWDTTGVPDGEYTVRITATELGSTNQDVSVSTGEPVVIDNPDTPDIQVSEPAEGDTVSGNVLIGWVATDQDGDDININIEYSTDQDEWTTISSDILNDGAYTWDTETGDSAVVNGDYYIRITASDGTLEQSVVIGPITVANDDETITDDDDGDGTGSGTGGGTGGGSGDGTDGDTGDGTGDGAGDETGGGTGDDNNWADDTDTDGDGIPDWYEKDVLGTDHEDPSDTTNVMVESYTRDKWTDSPDTDGDQLPDWWEEKNYLNPQDPMDATDDLKNVYGLEKDSAMNGIASEDDTDDDGKGDSGMKSVIPIALLLVIAAVVAAVFLSMKKKRVQKPSETSASTAQSTPTDPPYLPNTTPFRTAAPIQTTAPARTAAPIQTTAPARTAAPIQTTAPTWTAAPIQTTAPAQNAGPIQTTAPARTAAPIQTTAPAQNAGPIQTNAPAQNHIYDQGQM